MQIQPDPLDESWRGVAVAARAAITSLGYKPFDECLPGEPGGGNCGLGVGFHAAAYLTVLKTLAGHHLSHLEPITVVFANELALMAHDTEQELSTNCKQAEKGKSNDVH